MGEGLKRARAAALATRAPKALSAGEELFAMHCKEHGLTPVREHVFYPGRRWRFDFAFLHEKIAVEIEGGSWNGGRHTRGSGFEADCSKYNHAALQEWLVFRFTTPMVKSGDAIDTVMRAIGTVSAV